MTAMEQAGAAAILRRYRRICDEVADRLEAWAETLEARLRQSRQSDAENQDDVNRAANYRELIAKLRTVKD